jgi:hypothetical protein
MLLQLQLVKISIPEGAASKGGMVELDGIVHWLPHRPWYVHSTFGLNCGSYKSSVFCLIKVS